MLPNVSVQMEGSPYADAATAEPQELPEAQGYFVLDEYVAPPIGLVEPSPRSK